MTITEVLEFLEVRINNYKVLEEGAAHRRDYTVANAARINYKELQFVYDQLVMNQ